MASYLSLFVICGILVFSEANLISEANKPKMNVMLVAPPSTNNPYYYKPGKEYIFQQYIDFYLSYFKVIQDNKKDSNDDEEDDEMVIVADQHTMPYFTELSQDYGQYLLQTNSNPQLGEAEEFIDDPWVRDVGPVIPSYSAEFNYVGGGTLLAAQNNQRFFDKFADSRQNPQYAIERSFVQLLNDGGNVVDNNLDTVMITDKILKDNRHLTRSQIIEELKEGLGVTQVVILPRDEEKLGHSDGIVSMLCKDVVAVTDYSDENFQKEVKQAIIDGCPECQIFKIPSFFDDSKAENGYASSCGVYINSVVTNKYIYMPTFETKKCSSGNETYEDCNIAAQNAMQAAADKCVDNEKKVIPIPGAEKVCMLGGSVRCLSLQLEGQNAINLLERARDA